MSEGKMGIELTVSAGAHLEIEALGEGKTRTTIGGGSGMDLLALLSALIDQLGERLEVPPQRVLAMAAILLKNQEVRHNDE